MFCRIIVGIITFALAVLAIIDFESVRVSLMISVPMFLWLLASLECAGSFKQRVLFVIFSFFVFIFYSASFTWYVYQGNLVDPNTDWFFKISYIESPCNESSCSKNTVESLTPYNPNGWFDSCGAGSECNPYVHWTYCPYDSCRWADNNGLPIKGYNRDENGLPTIPCNDTGSCDYAASTKKEDYPNKAKGLTSGYGLDASTLDTTFCPAVRLSLLNEYGFIGKGSQICSTCTVEFVRRHKLTDPDPSCPEGYGTFCFACPGWYEGEGVEPRQIRSSSFAFFLCILMIVFTTVYAVWPCRVYRLPLHLRGKGKGLGMRVNTSFRKRGWPSTF